MPELTPVSLALLATMPILLACSAFFSGSETALFGLRPTERRTLRQRGSLAGRAVDALLRDQRQLLITLQLGNMTVNTLYFVAGSAVIVAGNDSPVWGVTMSAASLLTIVLVGEVLPKILFDAARVRCLMVAAPMVLAFHRLIAPLRIALDRTLVAPLSRLTAPARVPTALSAEELAALVDLSSREGVIDADEQRLLERVIQLRRLRVRDVMTPRVQMHGIPVNASRQAVARVSRQARLTRLPVHREDLDDIVGVLHVKNYLLDARGPRTPLAAHTTPATFVPEVATLEQLLELFRHRQVDLAITLDEYGGTAGIVATEDVVEELVGDIRAPEESEVPPPRSMGRGRWRVSGGMSVHEWPRVFGTAVPMPRVATVGGLVLTLLGRVPTVGDRVRVGNVELEVIEMDGHGVRTVDVSVPAGQDLEVVPGPSGSASASISASASASTSAPVGSDGGEAP